ncbi:hypothetical protein [Sandaracinus amylolyticus]|uniref:Uncharacterized protein n=1 Tax=Sandaracinus amylolyticus TaxID=927083 RepID=A0A0F6SHY3_9BACT|nr:hypothetical protein [Sandaracinus amylolyticus]AKF11244.1 hypothetical protein DB32_008393 [Sandaracinus amylolyticus]
MTHRIRSLALPLVLLALATTSAVTSLALAERERHHADDPDSLARRAVDPDPDVAEPAIASLRALGPAGHAALLRVHAAAITTLRDAPPLAPDDATERLRRAIDVVSAQRDGHASGLYWHTDLDTARAEARRTGRPILSLRLLGRLDEELSCANSRFFRTVLYPNAAVARVLSERFVLHWSSERPAPVITIDMGDGRRIERTVTGNSVHYVLDADGRPIDAIPGLYAPAQFTAALERGHALATRCAPLARDAFDTCLRDGHDAELAELERSWEERRASAPELPLYAALQLSDPGAIDQARVAAPSALVAMPITVGKAAIETPMMRLMARDVARVTTPPPIRWELAATADVLDARPDARTLALLRLKTGRRDVDALAARLASVAAIDGARNEVTLHRRARGLLRTAPGLTVLNERVYAELFLTPASDPWLGLRADDLWDALEVPAGARAERREETR